MSVRVVFTNRSGFDAPIGVVMAWEERGSCINIFRTTNRGRISETLLPRKSLSDLRDLHELRCKTLVAQVSERRRFALYLRTGVVLMLPLESSWHGRSVDHVLTYFGREIAAGSQKPSRITRQNTCCAIVMAWEERGSCLIIFRMTNRGRISETFTNYDENTGCTSQLNMSVRVVFANRSGFDAPIGVVMAWE
ncbi:uncharacterized protein G2W53_009940 [Senna tora]|uniref:Uncharacterized protein n=1 Tax=Senna tora TaxID=362788 RepID=A0A835CAR0_9FABA|nr:uncharacterized protein G2W53_009940 [Senna tora]